MDLVVLRRALQYCLENSTFSFGNLKDTYNHFGRELNLNPSQGSQGSQDSQGSQGSQEAGISQHPIMFLNPEYRGGHKHKPLPAATRDVKGYQAMIAAEKREANLFFNLISEAYENLSVIVTSNKSFETWAEMMGDGVITTALLDRLLHHARVYNLDGESYRTKKLKN